MNAPEDWLRAAMRLPGAAAENAAVIAALRELLPG
jgi:hypothetical protein